LAEGGDAHSRAKAKQKERIQPINRQPTMSDVARLAGVGAMTVSRFLSGAVPVSEETAKRVRVAIDQLSYRPNELARAFRGQKSRSIGVIIPYLYDPFFATCAHAITTVARSNGYSVLITTSNADTDTEYDEAERMLQHHVDGLVVLPARYRETRLTRSLFGKTPVVIFDCPIPDESFDTVLVQNTPGSHKIVQHLIGHGHKRIVFMGLSRSIFTINARFLGYRRAMQEADLQEDAFFGCHSQEDTLKALEDRMRSAKAPSAIFTSNTLTTRYVMNSLYHMGVRIPGDAAFAGFDDFDGAELTSSPLTVIRQPAQEMGRVAANLLFERILRGELPRTGTKVTLPVEMVLRRSCGCKHRTPVLVSA
jgi:LacI family transcriptional regulator